MFTTHELICDNNLKAINPESIKDHKISESTLIFLVKKNYYQMLKFLLDNEADLPYFSEEIFTFIVLRSRFKIIDVLIHSKYARSSGSVSVNGETFLYQACVHGKLNVAKHLINNHNISPTYNDNICFSRAYENRREKLFLYLWSLPKVKNTLEKTHKSVFDNLMKLKLKENVTNF